MSLSLLRDAVIKSLQEKADSASSRAINNHPHGHQSADTYAMNQIDALSEARACLVAIQIVVQEYNSLTRPEQKKTDAPEQEKQKAQEPIY